MRLRKALAIKIESWDKPCLMMLDDDGVLYYAGRFQNIGFYNSKYHTVVKDYGVIDFDDYDKLDKLEIKLCREYPPNEGIEELLTGWILPGGRFFSCRSFEHDSMAFYIYKYVYGKWLGGGIRQIENEGWVRVFINCVRYKQTIDITNAQIDTLSEIYIKTDNEQFKMLYKWLLEEREDYD